MSAVSDSRRAAIADRAGHRCEYCGLSTLGQVSTFPVDHIISRIEGGQTVDDNLALSSPRCNSKKWKRIRGIDPEMQTETRLFHPRFDTWTDHFFSDSTTGRIEGRTSIGRATVSLLGMNDEEMIQLRLFLLSKTQLET